MKTASSSHRNLESGDSDTELILTLHSTHCLQSNLQVGVTRLSFEPHQKE